MIKNLLLMVCSVIGHKRQDYTWTTISGSFSKCKRCGRKMFKARSYADDQDWIAYED